MADNYLTNENLPRPKKVLHDIFCATCEINFDNQESYKAHYQTDFHQYNLKRRILKLSPLELEVYEQNKRQILSRTKPTGKKEEDFSCQACKKSFRSSETLQQHLESKMHLEKSKKASSAPAEETKPAPFVSAIGNNAICLFCSADSESMKNNLEHMWKEHSFFIPKEDQCKNKEGLLKALATRIEKHKRCINCEFIRTRSFISATHAQMHMRDLGHCQMNLEYLNHYKKFYRPLPANPIAEDSKKKNDADEDGSDWVTESESDDSDIEPFQKRPKRLPTGELLLPDGRIIGHKRYKIYYKQTPIDHTKQIEQMRKVLMLKNVIPQSDALVPYTFQDMRQLYVDTMRNKKELDQAIAETEKFDLAMHGTRRTRARRFDNKVYRHNRVLTKYFRVQFRQ